MPPTQQNYSCEAHCGEPPDIGNLTIEGDYEPVQQPIRSIPLGDIGSLPSRAYRPESIKTTRSSKSSRSEKAPSMYDLPPAVYSTPTLRELLRTRQLYTLEPLATKIISLIDNISRIVSGCTKWNKGARAFLRITEHGPLKAEYEKALFEIRKLQVLVSGLHSRSGLVTMFSMFFSFYKSSICAMYDSIPVVDYGRLKCEAYATFRYKISRARDNVSTLGRRVPTFVIEVSFCLDFLHSTSIYTVPLRSFANLYVSLDKWPRKGG